jgi:hypothetical protein
VRQDRRDPVQGKVEQPLPEVERPPAVRKLDEEIPPALGNREAP